tara:strand:- start:829 stop:2034 length:1206 start_codon:yes stop_codon:yes gene_type:complete
MKEIKNILIGITGSIAAYKSADLVSQLIKNNYNVKIIMTKTAQDFITPLTFEALTNEKVYLHNTKIKSQPMLHIDLAKWADLILIAPATAEFMAKTVHGRGDDLLSTVTLAFDKQIAIAPSMNKNMWENKATQKNYNELKNNGVIFFGPTHGLQACGDIGLGRMTEPHDIVEDIKSINIQDKNLFSGKKIIVTAGPTVEMIDPIRYISNRSSGKMGCEIADAFFDEGGDVLLVKGPASYSTRNKVNTIEVESAKDMLNAIEMNIKSADLFVSVAAVSDYTVEEPKKNKIKSNEDLVDNIELKKNIDILNTISTKYPVFTIGFSAETEDLKKNSLKKLREKNLNVIAANKVSYNEGINNEENEISLYWENQHKLLSKKSKNLLAREFVTEISKIYIGTNDSK